MGTTQSTPSYPASTASHPHTQPQYPITKKAPSIYSNTSQKRPKPFVGSFFDEQMSAATNQATRPNRSAGHINFFEVAAMTHQPAKSIKSKSTSASSQNRNNSISNTTTKKSSLYPPSQRSASVVLPAEDYVVINNRKYWKGQGSQNFILPFDDDEIDRCMTLHYVLKATFGDNFTSPVQDVLKKEGTKVLDIGCGSGTWILEMATEYPNANFYGLDDCPLFPQAIKPANSHFKQHNVLKGLPYPDNEFDFVFMRLMVYYFTPEELSQLLSEISRVTKPGGYFEVIDTNYNVQRPGPISNKTINLHIKKAIHSSDAHRELDSTNESSVNHPIFAFLMAAPDIHNSSFIGNFTGICQEHVMLPLGNWEESQVNKLHSLSFETLLTSIQFKDLTPNEVTPELVAELLKECKEYRSYFDWFSCYAKKPLEIQPMEQNTLDSIYEFAEGFVDV